MYQLLSRHNGTKLNTLPLNKPLSLSLSFKSGITNSAINESVINGADSFEPFALITALTAAPSSESAVPTATERRYNSF